MMNKKLFFGILTISIAVIGGWLLLSNINPVHEYSETSVAHTAVAKIEKISVWNHGKEDIFPLTSIKPPYTKLGNLLLSIIENTNLQAKCAFFDEDVDMLKNLEKVVEVKFKEPVNITISQWIEPEDKHYIPTNDKGYRVLVNVEKIVFVLEGRFRGHILTKSANMQGYGCWAIKKDGKIDSSWINEVENAISNEQ